MDAFVISDLERGKAADPDRESAGAHAGRRDRLGVSMIVLGTATFLCAAGESAVSFIEWNSSGPLTWSATSLFLGESPPIFVIAMSWPLLIGLLIRRPRGSKYLPVASLTFFALAMGGVLEVIRAISLRSESPVLVGSFVVSPVLLLRGQPGAWARAMAGMLQVAFELIVAIAAAIETRAQRSIPGEREAARARVRGRLAFYLTVCFVLVCIRIPIWSSYVTLVNQSSFVRSFVMATDTRARYRKGTYGPGQDPFSRWATLTKLNEAAGLAAEDRVPEAKRAYLAIISQIERGRKSGDHGFDAELAQALNNLAWMLATCEDPDQRQPSDAVGYAMRAVELEERDGNYRNTLGVAYVRSGQYQDAQRALARSMELRQGAGDAYDWYFLAILQARQGNLAEARGWYEKAVEWTTSARPDDRELHRFRVETARELGIPAPPPGRFAERDEPGSPLAPAP
ncbi:tetratricopeptide repeat protein [Aquisphaera insulae]|uniref:tetratricopeptide repeat protein n=1 Tax=Aquisphaera insulae TaxID=2712864 RepID=UPI0013ED4E89|nr:tetratricopeptide repeat protein [Aquisphaera insulae]